LENNKAIKLIDKILANLDETGINTTVLIDDIKELRTYALEQQVPLVVKVLRLAYEHIEANQSFLIAIPNDDEFEDQEEETETVDDEVNSVESLKYFIALTRNLNNKINIIDLKAYKAQLLAS